MRFSGNNVVQLILMPDTGPQMAQITSVIIILGHMVMNSVQGDRNDHVLATVTSFE